MEESDAAAVARARAGDSDGFRVLVERHSRSVFRLAYRVTGNEQDAEDAVQETFLRAYRQLNRYESRSSFGTWLYRITANYCLDLIRVRKRYQDQTGSASEEQDAMAAVPAADTPQDRMVFSAEVRDRISSALAALSEQERMAFVLRHYEGCSIEQISGVLGIGDNAAKHSIFRAVQKLRKALEPVTRAAPATERMFL
jgi:RNA polymerase sigma-70 factor (ECF subfamily)